MEPIRCNWKRSQESQWPIGRSNLGEKMAEFECINWILNWEDLVKGKKNGIFQVKFWR